MKRTFALILSVALSGAILAADIAAAYATKMDGKCCVSSDGGRSYRYRMAVLRAQIPHTCTVPLVELGAGTNSARTKRLFACFKESHS
jgi:hypothetical protein